MPVQRQDFVGILRAMAGLPVTIRLLDPPLHEFLPQGEEEIKRVSDALTVSPDVVLQRITQLHEFNPMLGHRGVRLAVTYPEIYEVQTQAIIEAACHLVDEGVDVLQVMVVVDREEGAEEKINPFNLDYRSLIKISDLVD